MSRINQIQDELRQIDGGRFQTLANQYLCRRYSLGNCVHFGSSYGTDKTTTGIPDMYSIEEGRFFFAAFTTSTTDIRNKLLTDARDCLDENKTHVDSSLIDHIVLCHTTPRLSPSIAAEVSRIDPRIDIVGPEAMADDLDKKYASLAHLTLGIPLGKGSFIEPKAFIERYSHGRFTTSQSKELLYRDDEISSIIDLISANKAVLIHGQSGSGKTRIALESCKRFSKANNWDFLVLDSRYSNNIDEDIELVLPESENLVILVDDANYQVSLDHLLSVCAGNSKLKLVFTSRKMYRGELVSKLDYFLEHSDIELTPLSAKKIDAILETEYGIKNRIFRERVAAIANGNLRLAIMAAVSLTEGDREAIREPYDLLKFYMDSALSNYSKRECHLIEFLAIYDSCDLIEGNPCYDHMKNAGYTDSEIREMTLELNEREIATTLQSTDGVLAVRMEEQNLRDFLICRHFAKEKRDSFADFILATADKSNAQYLKAAKSMIEVCGSESVYEYIRRECEKAWRTLKYGDTRVADQFISSFNRFLPVQALSYAASHIEESNRVDISDEILNSNMTSDNSAALSIFVSLIDLDEYSETAIDLFAECIEKGCEQPSNYKWACGPNGAFSRSINNEGFEIEHNKLEALTRTYQETASLNVAACLILLADSLLSSKAERTCQNGITFTINSVSYKFTSQLAELHAHCFQALSAFKGTEFENRSKKLFQQHFSFFGKTPDNKHAENMMSVLTRIEDLFPLFVYEDSTSDLSCCIKINQIYAACNHECPMSLDQFSQGTKDALGCENEASSTEREYKVDATDLSIERLKDALIKLSEDSKVPEKQWKASRAIESVLLEIAKRDPRSALRLLADLTSTPDGIHIIPTSALDYLADTLGRKTLRNEIGAALVANDHPGVFDYLDIQAIQEGPEEQEIGEILSRVEDGRYHLDLETIEKVEPKRPGFVITYAKNLSEHIKDTSKLRLFFGNSCDAKRINALNRNFASNPFPAINLYFLALEGYPHFDYSLAFLRCLVRMEPSVQGRYFEYVSNLDYSRKHDLMQQVSSFWTESDESAWMILKSFINYELSGPLSRFDVSPLFPIHNTSVFSGETPWKRLESLISEHLASTENLSAISWALSECNDETRIRVLSLILTLDKEGATIGHLSLRRSSMSGSAEAGFIPAKKKEIEVLDAVAKQLPGDTSYLKHREWIAGAIRNIEADINREKWDLFHGKR